jgi:hydrogenase maturation factor HypE
VVEHAERGLRDVSFVQVRLRETPHRLQNLVGSSLSMSTGRGGGTVARTAYRKGTRAKLLPELSHALLLD